MVGNSDFIRYNSVEATRDVSGIYEHYFRNGHFLGGTLGGSSSRYFWLEMVFWDSDSIDLYFDPDCVLSASLARSGNINSDDERKINAGGLCWGSDFGMYVVITFLICVVDTLCDGFDLWIESWRE